MFFYFFLYGAWHEIVHIVDTDKLQIFPLKNISGKCKMIKHNELQVDKCRKGSRIPFEVRLNVFISKCLEKKSDTTTACITVLIVIVLSCDAL